MSQFPRQDIPESEKTIEWGRKHCEYGRRLIQDRNASIDKKTRLYNRYNGRTVSAAVRFLTQTYGKKNRTKYISYRMSRTKIDMLTNEFLKRPLYSYVSTINVDAKSSKLENYEMMLGAAHSSKEIQKLREVGVDPLNGADIPDINDETIWDDMNFKERNEKLMQTLVDSAIKEQNLKLKFSKNFQDLKIVSEVYGKIDIDENGDEEYIKIDPRNSIFEEIEEDYFIEKSPIMGSRQMVPIHNALMRYRFTKEERDQLDAIRQTGRSDNTNVYFVENGSMCVEVVHVEWKSVAPTYYILSPKTQKQLNFDDETTFIRKELDAKKYEAKKEWYDGQVSAGKFQIETKFHEQLYECSLIGNKFVKDFRLKPFTTRRIDKPGDVFSFSYCGALFNTVNSERISLQEITENFDNMFDIVMFQIMKELNKAKGKILAFNRSALPKDKKIADIIYDVTNDSFLDYDSSSTGNWSGKNLDGIKDMLQEFDLGLSSSFPQLIALKQEIKATVDQITGINENREGNIAASSTATNANSSIQASRTITEGMFYFMNLYIEKVLIRLCETMKLTWGLYKPEKGKVILGDSMFNFMLLTKDLYNGDYGLSLVDGGKELTIRDRMTGLAEASLNAKELRYRDVLAYELTDTLNEGKKVLESAWSRMEKIRQDDMAAQRDAEAKLGDKNLQMQLQISREDREDRQQADIQKINVKGDTDIRVNAAKEKHGMIRDQNEFEQTAVE